MLIKTDRDNMPEILLALACVIIFLLVKNSMGISSIYTQIKKYKFLLHSYYFCSTKHTTAF